MAPETIAAKITRLEALLVTARANLASAQSGGQSFSLGDISGSAVNYNTLQEEVARIEKSLQRLYRGGRGIVVDMSYGANTQAAFVTNA